MLSQHSPQRIPTDPFSEQILNLLPLTQPPIPHLTRYTSQYAPIVRQKFTAVKKQTGSLGPSNASQSTPKEFIRRGQGQFKFKQGILNNRNYDSKLGNMKRELKV